MKELAGRLAHAPSLRACPPLGPSSRSRERRQHGRSQRGRRGERDARRRLRRSATQEREPSEGVGPYVGAGMRLGFAQRSHRALLGTAIPRGMRQERQGGGGVARDVEIAVAHEACGACYPTRVSSAARRRAAGPHRVGAHLRVGIGEQRGDRPLLFGVPRRASAILLRSRLQGRASRARRAPYRRWDRHVPSPSMSASRTAAPESISSDSISRAVSSRLRDRAPESARPYRGAIFGRPLDQPAQATCARYRVPPRAREPSRRADARSRCRLLARRAARDLAPRGLTSPARRALQCAARGSST